MSIEVITLTAATVDALDAELARHLDQGWMFLAQGYVPQRDSRSPAGIIPALWYAKVMRHTAAKRGG